MKLENGGFALAYEVPESLAAGSRHEIVVELTPPGHDTHVELEFSTDGEVQHREGRRLDGPGESARYTLELPAFAAGEHVSVAISARSGRRRIPRKGDEAAARLELDVVEPATATSDGAPAAPALDALLPERDAPGVRRAAAKLEQRGIKSAEDLLAAGDSALSKLPARDRRVVGRLLSHAALALTTSDAHERNALLEAGFSSPAAVATVAPLAFRQAVGDRITPARADDLHRTATAQAAFLNGLSTASSSYAATAAPPMPIQPAARCGCKDCEAATSPLAYLADLIAYVNTGVQVSAYGWPASPLDVDGLTTLLRQPLRDLLASCGAVTKSMRQVRLVIETLRRHLAAMAPPDADLICSPLPLPMTRSTAWSIGRALVTTP